MFHPNHDIAYSPIDLPRYDPQGEIESGFNTDFASPAWTQNRLTENYSTDGQPYSMPRPWLADAKSRFPRLIDFVDEHLPFKTVCIAKIIYSANDQNLGFHVDIGRFDTPDKVYYDHQYRYAPCAYRIVLGGQYQKVLFYASRADAPREKWTWSELPMETNVFVHSSVDSLHGAVYDHSIKRFILIIHGWMDLERHHELLTRSRKKYAQYVITQDDLIRNDQ